MVLGFNSGKVNVISWHDLMNKNIYFKAYEIKLQFKMKVKILYKVNIKLFS